MEMNFGGLEEVSAVVKRSLRPYTINKVQLKSIEHKEGQQKKDPTQKWQSLVLHFEGEDGSFSDSKFYPTDASSKRFENTYKDKDGNEFKVESPSSFEQLKVYMLHLITVVGGDAAKDAFITNSAKCKDTDQFMKVFQAVVNKYCLNKDFYLKLTGRAEVVDGKETGRYFPTIPNIGALNRESGKLYIKSNFASIQDGVLAFTNYEMNKKAEMDKRKPTEMPAVSEETKSIDTVTEENKAEEADFDAILNAGI